jgi:hypothetical protein
MAKTGISALAVAVVTAGGVLVYAGFRGINPLEAIREVGSGKPVAIANQGTVFSTDGSVAGQDAAIAARGNNLGSRAGAAAQKYIGDKYSQAKRTQSGWSDCSSFCDKILRDIGIPPPTKWASTANYRLQSGGWKVISKSSAMPGDVAVNSHHMVMITGAKGASAIGQQNPRVNVRTGTVDQLIDSYKVYRYLPGTSQQRKVERQLG